MTASRRSIGVIGALYVAIASTAAAAEQQPLRVVEKPLTKEEARFRALDSNSDQKLSEVELRADPAASLELAKLDTDHDGFLSLSEYVSRPIPPAKKKAPTR